MPVWRQVPLVKKKIILLHLASSVSVFFFYPQKKLWDTNVTSLICSRSTNEIFSEPWLRKTKTEKGTVADNRLAQEWTYSLTTFPRFIINATKNYQKGRIEFNFFLPLGMGNTTRHLQLLHPSDEELNHPRRDRVKGVLVNTPTFTWAYRRIWRKGE